MTYFLAKDAFVCESSGYTVFLDLKSDRYLALPPDDTPKFRRLIFEGPTECEDLGEFLGRQGLLVKHPSLGKPVQQQPIAPATHFLWKNEGAWPHLLPIHFRQFTAAYIKTALMLKLYSLRNLVDWINSKRDRQWAEPEEMLIAEALPMVGVFYLLSSLTKLHTKTCIQQSFTMINFLALNGIYPRWVFGVQMQPFQAHCWVQQGTVVFNDSSRVRAFTPLMIV
jgi:hypothetical protein